MNLKLINGVPVMLVVRRPLHCRKAFSSECHVSVCIQKYSKLKERSSHLDLRTETQKYCHYLATVPGLERMYAHVSS